MNKEDIINLARECGLTLRDEPMLGVERFADLVAAAAREAWAAGAADNSNATIIKHHEETIKRLQAELAAERKAHENLAFNVYGRARWRFDQRGQA